jgi:hypothetical protein
MAIVLCRHETAMAQSKPKKIYMSYILHGNMNYDRYVKTTIWRDFPIIYDNLMNYLETHPEYKGQIQLSGQSFLSLKQAAPYVIEHAMKLYKQGQLNFTGTFYSEPVNVSMDGETNFRCARLGTSIINDAVGFTDGFFLQEWAHHAQLPWVLKQSGVSWVPLFMSNSTFPFKLRGMDGTLITCVPICSRKPVEIFKRIKEAPENSLLLIDGDYEIPQAFGRPFEAVTAFDQENKDVEIEWITVKEYIEKIGVKEEMEYDHTVKALHIDDGTYSRWTADPLDIIIHDYTNHASWDFRAAGMMNSISNFIFKVNTDLPVKDSKLSYKEDQTIWDIEQIKDYPEVEPKFLLKNGEVTTMSRIEHLLVWAVNSDARGHFPLYERRRERINSFANCSSLSQDMIARGLDVIVKNMKVEGYDKYFILFNAEPRRVKTIKIETNLPYDVFDYGKAAKLKSICLSTGKEYSLEFVTELPAYGYKVIGLKQSQQINENNWQKGNGIKQGNMSLTALNDKIILDTEGKKIEISLDSFMIKALAEMTMGKGDDVLRKATPYGDARISTRNGIHPQLRIEKQIDWLVHLQQTYTLLPDRLIADFNFVFPHPCIIRKEAKVKALNFDSRGLIVRFNSGKSGKVYYDIPFGIAPHDVTQLSYFTALSTGIIQYDQGGGYMVTAGTGEQAFDTNAKEGVMGLYLGASTTTGPNRKMKIDFVSDSHVEHEQAWYAEPFMGTYNHQFMLFPFNKSWQESQAPSISRSYTQEVYIREFHSSTNSGTLPPEKSLISLDQQNVEITSMEMIDGKLQIRLNEKTGKESDIVLSLGDKKKKVHIKAYGIVNVNF